MRTRIRGSRDMTSGVIGVMPFDETVEAQKGYEEMNEPKRPSNTISKDVRKIPAALDMLRNQIDANEKLLAELSARLSEVVSESPEIAETEQPISFDGNSPIIMSVSAMIYDLQGQAQRLRQLFRSIDL